MSRNASIQKREMSTIQFSVMSWPTALLYHKVQTWVLANDQRPYEPAYYSQAALAV